MCDPKPFYELIVKEKIKFLAEREGFEPSIVLLLYTLSKRAEKNKVKELQQKLTVLFYYRVCKCYLCATKKFRGVITDSSKLIIFVSKAMKSVEG